MMRLARRNEVRMMAPPPPPGRSVCVDEGNWPTVTPQRGYKRLLEFHADGAGSAEQRQREPTESSVLPGREHRALRFSCAIVATERERQATSSLWDNGKEAEPQKRDLSLVKAHGPGPSSSTRCRISENVPKLQSHLDRRHHLDLPPDGRQPGEGEVKFKKSCSACLRSNIAKFEGFRLPRASWETRSRRARRSRSSPQFTCHELHLFLNFKDPKYFQSQSQALPGQQDGEDLHGPLSCSSNYAAIEHFKLLTSFATLNAMEQALLVHALMRLGQKEEAQEIAEFLKL